MSVLNTESIKIAVVGLGYVGLPLAVEFGKKRQIIGFDINEGRVNALKAGHDATLEVGDEELVQVTGLSFTNGLEDIAQCSAYIITVPTPMYSPAPTASTALVYVILTCSANTKIQMAPMLQSFQNGLHP